MTEQKTVLFLKRFRRLGGGHLKAWHYFEYLDEDPRFRPIVSLTWRSARHGNPWAELPREYRVRRGAPADLLFVDGLDWLLLPRRERERPRRPVVNLVQGIRHADPDDPRFAFLQRPAIRICVGAEVAEAVTGTGRVNGPVVTIPAATDLEPEPDSGALRPLDVFVAALKAPELGRRIGERLAPLASSVSVQTDFLPRRAFLDRLRSARVAVLLPLEREGCFLPALEAMAVGALVVCPDCVGNRSFCVDRVTCFRPPYEEDALVGAAAEALERSEDLRPMRERAWEAVRVRSRERERSEVTALFGRVDELWADLGA